MDVVGALGYIGQELRFIDGERFAFETGNALCVYDTSKGPREMFWRMESGIHSFCTNVESRLLAYTPASDGSFGVEVINISDQSLRAALGNSCGAPIISTCFSREGDKLFAITDTTDHQLLVWSIAGTCRQLATHKLASSFRRVLCNPCNANQICLFGDSGIAIYTLHEVLGNFTIKCEELDSAPSTVQFALWLPQNRVLVGDKAGNVHELTVEKKISRLLGQFSVPDKRGNRTPVVATHAVLSVANLIVGTEQGHLYWYPVLALMGVGEDEPILDLNLPVQTCSVHSAVSSLTMDQTFQTLLVGTFEGAIFKVPVEVVESDFGRADPDADLANGGDAGRAFKPIEAITATHLGNDPHRGGVTLCTAHLTIEVQKFSARSRSSLSLFITGSHLGVLQFWRYSSQVVDNMTPNAGIRRSAPRALRAVFELALCSDGVDGAESIPAVCSMEMVQLPMKHARLLVIGTEDGCIEVWTIEAQENEDEDARDSSSSEDKGGYSLRLLEDDEGSCLVRLEARRVFQTKLFGAPVTLICSFPAFVGEQINIKFAVASERDQHVYFFSAYKEDTIAVLKNVESYVSLNTHSAVRAMMWTEDLLHLFCESGEVLLYQTKDCDVPKLKLKRGTGLPVLTDATLTATATSVAMLNSSNQLRLCPVKSLHDERIGVEFRAFDHSDVVVVVAHAPNGRLIATGCADGSVFVWRVEGETEEVMEANRVKPHAGAVSSLVFSSDSSLLLCCGIDGSCFLLTLDKPTQKGPNRNGSIRASFMMEDGPQYLSDLIPERAATDKEPVRSTVTWIEQKEAEKAKDLKSRHKFKAMGIGAAINEIAQRLRVLVSQNAERSDLEKLDRSEFVIDVKRRDAAELSNAEQAAVTRRLYAQRNYCNELRAARIRAKCWDNLEVKPCTVLPLAAGPESALSAGVSSFSVQKYSPEQLATLNKIKRLRAMEVRAQRADDQGSVSRLSGTPYYRCAWATALAGCPQSVTWISNDGARWPVSDKVALLLSADKAVDAAAGTAQGRDKGPDAAADAEEDDGSVDEEDHVLDEGNVLNLLYPPQAVRSQVQKRTQIALLKEVIRQVRVKFNEQFDKLRREKADIIASIESRNTRMNAILEDLHQSEELFTPAIANKEVQGSTVAIDASELRTVPYESEVNRQIRLREEEERRQRELAKDKEDAKGRALEEMMHGTLEVKRDVFAEASAFVKPEWMDTLTTTEMNESQLKEYDAYMSKLKALQEEQAIYRKALEQEMKRLKNEVSELCKAFDEKLAELASLKVLVHREIFSHEIYISRLALNMAKMEQATKFLRKSEEQVQLLRGDRAEVRRNIELLGAQLEEMKGRISAIQEEERQMDKTFRRDLQNLCNNTFDQDALKVLTMLYRQRTYPRGGGGGAMENFGEQSEADASASASKNNRRSKDGSARAAKTSKNQSKRAGGGLNSSSTNDVNKNKKLKASKGGASAGGGGGKDASLGPMQQAAQALRTSDEPSYKDKDPYYEALLELEKQKVMQEAQIPILSQLSIELDCPEGFDIDQFSWSKLQELRTARIEKEIEGKQLSLEFSKLKQKLERLDAEESVLANCISDIKASRDSAVASLRDLESNLDMVVRLRQGQDEVDKDAVVTDYSDALLLPSSVLAKYNTRIKELGKEKISVLSKIKLFRRKINLIDWEAKHHGMEARHYEAYLTDLQLFRVTRELQRVIRDGSDATQTKERLDKVAARIEYQAQDAEVKLLALKKNNEFLKRQLDDRQQECTVLEERIGTLRAQVNLSKSVKQSRDDARGGSGGDPITMAANKMKKVVARRHMVDTARAQAEEIDYLRQELDKMRQRTFPSFVKATRKRLTAVNGDAV